MTNTQRHTIETLPLYAQLRNDQQQLIANHKQMKVFELLFVSQRIERNKRKLAELNFKFEDGACN